MSPQMPVGDADAHGSTDLVRDVRMCALDFETTSPDPEEARIVTAAVSVVGGGGESQHFSLLVDPGVPIPEGATAVHGITTDRARAEGVHAHHAVETILGVLRLALQTVDGRRPALVAFNARFDLTVMDREARRHGFAPLQEQVPDMRVLDPLVIWKHYDRYRKGSRKLDAACAAFRVDLTDAHAADADALAAARVLWRMARYFPKLGARDVTEVHEAQVGWAREQAESLQEYFRRKDPAAVVEPAWPVIPWRPAAR